VTHRGTREKDAPGTSRNGNWALLLLSAAALYVVWPFWPPLLLAAWTAAMAQPLLRHFERRLNGRRRAAAVLCLLIFSMLAVPLALVAIGVISGGRDIFDTIHDSPSGTSALRALISSPDASPALPSSLAELAALVRRSGSQGLRLLSSVAGAAALTTIGVLIYFGGAFTLLVNSAELWAWIKRHSPLEAAHLDRFADAFQETGRGRLVGVGLTMVTQGLAATIIYLALGVPRAWVLGPMTGIAAIIPVVGTGLVWGPVSLGLFLADRPIHAVIMVVLGVLVISLIDNLLRPIFARHGALNMPLFLLFVAAFGGIAAFGTWGALMGPLIVRLAMEGHAIAKGVPPRDQQPHT